MNIPQIVRERLGIELYEIGGASLWGEIPLAEDAVNRLLMQRLQNHPQLTSLHVQAQENDTVAVEIVPRMRFVPQLRVIARIERQPQLPGDATLVLRWSMPAAGPLALLAAPLLSHWKGMPGGIHMQGDHITLDLRELLRARGAEDLLTFVRELAIHTRPGGFVARFRIQVEEGNRPT